MNDLLFIIWKMTQGWDEEEAVGRAAYVNGPELEDCLDAIRYAKIVGRVEAGQQIRELLTAAGYQHKEG
jgi:hypothetical protein